MRRTTTSKDEQWIKHYGDKYGLRRENEEHEPFIISSGNANFISKKGTPKLIALQDAIKGNAVQGLSEHNTNYSLVPQQDQLSEKFRKVWRRRPKIKTTWIKDRKDTWKSRSTVQQGGTALIATGAAAEYMHEAGEDSEGLARWTWMKFEGRSEVKTAVIQVYRPVYNITGPGSVYQQQQCRIKDGKEVLRKFDDDLIKLVDEMMEEGFRIIIMGDFNMDVRNDRKRLIHELKTRGIRERITGRYGKERASNTYRWGSETIDGMFASDELEMVRGGHREGNPALSDHKFIWGEFTYDSVLGVERGKAYTPEMRRLQLKYKKVTKKFIQLLVKYMNEHSMLKRAQELWESIKDDELNEEQWNKYETLDKEFEEAVQYADNKCRKLFPHDIEFSPEVKEAIGNLTIWKEIEKKIQKKQKIKGRYIRNLKEKYKVETYFDLQISEKECKRKVKQAWKEFNEVREKAPELRESFIDSLIREAEKLKTAEGVKKVKQLRNIKETERSREAHARVKAASGKFKSQGVRYVHKEMEDGSIVTITDPVEIEEEIIKANQAKLHQCNEKTPLRQSPLVNILTKFDYNVWEQFLQGEIPIPEGLEKGTEEYLKVYHGIDNNDFDILHTTKGLKKAWSKAKEKTSSAPGPIHYGTMKTMKWCLPMAEFQTIMANVPLRTSKTPSSWGKDVEAMLLKKKNEYRPAKLRRIGLLNCAFNMNNKHIGREAMKHAERMGQLAEEQFGSRKNLSAEKHALNKRLMLDIMRVTKTPGVLTANDAKSCYDRILHFATYAALRRAGVPKNAVISMVHTLRTMKHTVRTGYGDSLLHYGGEEDDDQHGATQGNGAGPAIWALVSSPLLDILRKEGYGAELISPIKKEFFHLCGFAFVDDTDTIQTGRGGATTEEIMVMAQEEMDLWECLIRSTGGAIEGAKSDFTVINWKWDGGKATYEPISEDNTLSCLDSEGVREELKQIPVTEARRTLGVWQAANGQEETQKEKMIEKADEWCNRIFKSNLSKSDIAMGVKTALYPSLTYGLMATALNEKQCDEIFAPIRNKIIPKMKICRTAPAEVIHGPTAYGGMEFKSIYTLQGIAHVKILIEEGDENTTTGRLLRNLIEQHILEVGLPGEMTDWDFGKISPIMTKSWVKNTLEYMERDRIKMDTGNPKLEKWTENDTFIIEDMIRAGIQGPQLQAVNRCRLYLQAITRSDLSDGGGSEILVESLQVERGIRSRSSEEYQWPYQMRPSAADRIEWKKALQITYGVDNRYKRWRTDCGKWCSKINEATSWLYVQSEDRLYEKENTKWNVWKSTITRRRRNGIFQKTSYSLDHRPSNTPMIAKIQRLSEDRVKLHGSRLATRSETTEENQEQSRGTARDLEEEIRTIDKTLIWAVEQLDLPADDGERIAEMIKEGKGRCMSDGSLKNKYGTSAYTFLISQDEYGMSGRNTVPGMDGDQSSYRSEMCGILGNLLLLNAICRYHNITENHKVIIGSDSESALWNSFGDTPLTTKMASYDLVAAVRHQVQISPLTFESKWVKGHQDTGTKKGKILDAWALANIECDKQASKIWNEKERQGTERRPGVEGRMPGEKWVCYTRQGKISTDIDQHLYDISMRNTMIEYWEKKERIVEGMSDDIDWNAHNKAMKKFGPRRIWVSKHFSGWAGSGKMMQRWKYRDNAKCPRCDEIEDTHHVVQCQSIGNQNSFLTAVEPLREWLEETTSPRIRSAVLTHVKAYQKNRVVGGFRTSHEKTKETSRKQDELGKRSFGEGLLHTGWKELQMKHYGGTDNMEKSERWVVTLIQKIWEISWTMWEARNFLIHNDSSVRGELFMDKINATIEVLHEEGRTSDTLFQAERKFFRRNPLHEVLKQNERNKILWIETAERYLDPDTHFDRSRSSQGVFAQWLNQARENRDEEQYTIYTQRTVDPPGTPVYEGRQDQEGRRTMTPVQLIQQQIQWARRSSNRPSTKRPRAQEVQEVPPRKKQQTLEAWRQQPSRVAETEPNPTTTRRPSVNILTERPVKRRRIIVDSPPNRGVKRKIQKRQVCHSPSRPSKRAVAMTPQNQESINERPLRGRLQGNTTNQNTSQQQQTTVTTRYELRPLRGRLAVQQKESKRKAHKRPRRGRLGPHSSMRRPLRGRSRLRQDRTCAKVQNKEQTKESPQRIESAIAQQRLTVTSAGQPHRQRDADTGHLRPLRGRSRPTVDKPTENSSNPRPLRGRFSLSDSDSDAQT